MLNSLFIHRLFAKIMSADVWTERFKVEQQKGSNWNYKTEKQNQIKAVFLTAGDIRPNVQWSIFCYQLCPVSKSQSTSGYECTGVQLSILNTTSWTKARTFPHLASLLEQDLTLFLSLLIWQKCFLHFLGALEDNKYKGNAFPLSVGYMLDELSKLLMRAPCYSQQKGMSISRGCLVYSYNSTAEHFTFLSLLQGQLGGLFSADFLKKIKSTFAKKYFFAMQSNLALVTQTTYVIASCHCLP